MLVIIRKAALLRDDRVAVAFSWMLLPFEGTFQPGDVALFFHVMDCRRMNRSLLSRPAADDATTDLSRLNIAISILSLHKRLIDYKS